MNVAASVAIGVITIYYGHEFHEVRINMYFGPVALLLTLVFCGYGIVACERGRKAERDQRRSLRYHTR